MKKLATVISTLGLLVGLGGGAAYALVFTPLVLVNGWVGGGFATAQPAVGLENGIVHFKGSIENGALAGAFVLPPAFRPGQIRFVPVDLANANKGRLVIDPDGTTFVQAEAGLFNNAQIFTSLDGASFAK